MAKIKPMILIESMSGKVCSHSDTYFAVRNGVQYTGTRCNKRRTPFTENELNNQTKFKSAHTAARQPTGQRPGGIQNPNQIQNHSRLFDCR